MINTGGIGHWGGDTNDIDMKLACWFEMLMKDAEAECDWLQWCC